MRISGIEPSSAILSQTKWFQKLKINAQKVPKQVELINNIDHMRISGTEKCS